MSRVPLFVVAVLLGCPAVGVAQAVVVISKPGNGMWDVSYTRMFEAGNPTTGTEMASSFKTLAAAKQEASRLQRWSQSMDANSSWRLKTIYIEGEDATTAPPKDAAPTTPTLFEKAQSAAEKVNDAKDKYDDAKWGLTLLTDPDEAIREKGEEWQKKFAPGAVLKEYSDNVKDAYQRVKDLKDPLLKLEKDAMEQSFGKVNDAVAKYNEQVDAGARFFSSSVSSLPRLTPLGPETVKAVGEWKNALKQQFDLEQQKEDLDGRKVTLDRTRDQLASDWQTLQDEIKPFDPMDARVVRLRERLKDYTADVETYNSSLAAYTADSGKLTAAVAQLRGDDNSSNDSVRLYIGQYSNTADLNGGGSGEEIASLDEARARAQKHLSNNAGKQPSYRIEDKDGTVIEAQGMFKNVKAAPKPNPTSADRTSKPDHQLCYICWIGDFGAYGGATREEAIAGGERIKQLNPTQSIRVTEHEASNSMTIDAIRNTPGKTILELP